MREPCLDYVPRADATPEGELAALAAVYAFVVRAHDTKEAAASLGEDGKEGEHETAVGPKSGTAHNQGGKHEFVGHKDPP